MTPCAIPVETSTTTAPGDPEGVGPDRLVLLAPDAVAPPAPGTAPETAPAAAPAAPPGSASGPALVPLSQAPPVPGVTPRGGLTVTADGSYGACLADAGGGAWYAERWTLGGPEPYTVALPANQPEDADAQVQPLPDGRVLILRGSPGRHDLALLYPTGPGTGEVPVGFLHGDEVRLLPPVATGSVYALRYADGVTTVWLVHGGQGLELLARVEGRCGGGVWLDRAGRLLALDREHGGRVKTVAVDLGTGAVSPLLQLTGESDDRLLMADPGSGLLLVRSDAPGTARLGWGVLGDGRPVRFPECLRDAAGPDGERVEPVATWAGPVAARVEPVAVRAGGPGAPESCAVLLRVGGRAALWRPGARRTASLPTPPGWLAGSGWWDRRGTLRLPFARPDEPYGVRDIAAERYLPRGYPLRAAELTLRQSAPLPARRTVPRGGYPPAPRPAPRPSPRPASQPVPPARALGRVVPLQQAPLTAPRPAAAVNA